MPKAAFQRAAYDRATAGQTGLNYDIEVVISQIELVKARQAEVATRRGPLLLSCVSLRAQGFTALEHAAEKP